MDRRAPLVAHVEAAKAVQPGEGAFDDPARAAEAAAVGRAALGELAADAAVAEAVAVGLRIVAPVPLDEIGFPCGTARSAPEGRDAVDQGQELRHIMAVGGRQDRDERNPLRVGENVVLTPALRRSVGFGPVFSRATPGATHCPPRPAPDRSGPVDAVRSAARHGAASTRQPAASARPAPARGAGPTAHLLRQHVPRQPAAQDEQDAGQHCAVRNGRAPGVPTIASAPRREERFDDRPELIIDGECRDARPPPLRSRDRTRL